MRHYFEAVRRSWREALLLMAAVGGWAGLTWGLAEALDASWLWKLSAGIFLLALVGFRFLAMLAWEGPYLLWRRNQQPSTSSDGERHSG